MRVSPAKWGMKWAAAFGVCAAISIGSTAQALELDWSGQFWSEFNWVHNYSLDSSDAGAAPQSDRIVGGVPQGYYIPGGGSREARWESLFMRLRPKLVVNDNIYIKSEWWVSDPIWGTFGNAPPFTGDQDRWYSNQSRGSLITAQRFWAELISDFGTLQVGRTPMQWGLGVVWNSGDALFSHYQSTGDTLRLISKFGLFSVIPSFTLYSSGNTIGGSCPSGIGVVPGACTNGVFAASVADYSLALKYENPEEDFEMGVNLIKRLAGADQSSHVMPDGTTNATGGAGKMNYNTWDLYGKKKFGKLTLGAEVPIASGTIGTFSYRSFAAALEAGLRVSDSLEMSLKAGHAPGQGNDTVATPGSFRAFFFNPNYNLGMIMFNYQLRNFSGPNLTTNSATDHSNAALVSPYDNPIVNATYLGWTGIAHVDKWDFNGSFVWARAAETFQPGLVGYNTWTRTFQTTAAGVEAQSNSLGWEMDYGATFNWDEYMKFKLDFGFFFPGDFFKFSNTSTLNATNMVFATSARVGINF